jgi:aspartate kinase
VRAGEVARANNEIWAISARHRALVSALEFAALEKAIKENSAQQEIADDLFVWSELESLNAYLRALARETKINVESPAWLDAVLSYGERASARLLAATLRWNGVQAAAMDASQFIVTNDEFQNASPLWEETRRRAKNSVLPLLEMGVIPVVTGFIGATLEGKVTTLGRNSSDYSAAIVADALDADEVCLWTDVDGIYDRDPRAAAGEDNGDLTLLAGLSYEEALDLAERGAKVLHPRTIEPLRAKNIALQIRNTFHPEHPGTRIGPAVRRYLQSGALNDLPCAAPCD